MEIKEVVEQIRKIARVENDEISIGKGSDREMNELTHYIIVAILNGYTLCKVDEAAEKMRTRYWVSGVGNILECIEIIKEACK